MKKSFFVLIGVLLVFTFVFIGCDNGTNGGGEEQMTKFEGSWKHPNTQALNATYVFSGNNWAFTSDGNGTGDEPVSSMSGTFIFTNTNITFTATTGGTGSWTQNYTFENDGLTLRLEQQNNLVHVYGPFNKQQP
jgi:hypothetical protein